MSLFLAYQVQIKIYLTQGQMGRFFFANFAHPLRLKQGVTAENTKDAQGTPRTQSPISYRFQCIAKAITGNKCGPIFTPHNHGIAITASIGKWSVG